MSLGILMYVDDYDGKFPIAGINVTNSPVDPYCAYISPDQPPTCIYPYLRSADILHCPSDGNMDTTYFGGAMLSYAFNGGCTADEWNPGGPAMNESRDITGGIFGCYGVAEANIPEPGNVILMLCEPFNTDGRNTYYVGYEYMWDITNLRNLTSDDQPKGIYQNAVCWWTLLCPGTIGGNRAAYMSGPPYPPFGTVVHSGGTNFGFCDGHAKWMKVEKTINPKNLWLTATGVAGVDPWGRFAAAWGF
jgi:prepilin-type processing-associated H-X9-DG protein